MTTPPDKLVIEGGLIDDQQTWSCDFTYDRSSGLDSNVTVVKRSRTEYFPNDYFLIVSEAENLGDLEDPFVIEFRSRIIEIAQDTDLLRTIQEDSKQSWFCVARRKFEPVLLIEPIVHGLFYGEFGTRLVQWTAQRASRWQPVETVQPPKHANLEQLSLIEISLEFIATDAELGTDKMFETLRAVRGLSRRGINEDREIMAAVRAGQKTLITTEMLPSEADRYQTALNRLGASVSTRVLGPVDQTEDHV